MNKIKTFFTLVKLEFSSAKSESNNKNKFFKNKIVLIILNLILFIYFGSLGYTLSKSLIETLTKTGSENYFVSIIIVGLIGINFAISMISAIAYIMRDKTNSILNTYPISSRKRFAASFVSYIISGYSFTLMIGTVPLIYFGIAKGSSFDYYIFVLLAILLLPILVLTIVYVFSFIVNSIIKLLVSKKFIKWAGMLVMFVFIGIYVKIYNSMFLGEDTISKILSFVQSIEKSPIFWYPKQIINIITGENRFISILIVTGINIGAYLLTHFTIGTIYIKEQLRLYDLGSGIGIINFIRSRKRNNKKSNEISKNEETQIKENINLNKDLDILTNIKYKKKNPSIQYLKHQFAFFLKEPAVLVNTVIAPIILPIFMSISFISGFSIRMKEVKKAEAVYFVQDYKEEANSKEERDALLNNPTYSKYAIEEKDGKYIFIKYSILFNNEYDKQRRMSGLPAVERTDDNKFVLKEGEEYSKKQENMAVEKVFTTDLMKENNNEFYEFLNKNKEKYNLNQEAINGLMLQFTDSQNAYNSSNIFEYFWKARTMLKDRMGSSLDKYIIFMIPVVLSGVILLFAPISIFMISKDKNDRPFIKSMPMSDLRQFNIKRLPGILVKILFLVIYIVAVDLIFNLFLYRHLFFWLGFVFTIITMTLFDTIELYADSRKPNFNWKTPIYLVKQSLKSFLAIMLKIQFIATAVLVYVFLFYMNNIGLNIFVYIFVSIILLTTIILEMVLYKKRNRLLEKV